MVTSSASPQCDWSKKIAVAIQRRYQTNENACKALLAPPDEFNQAHALLENELLSQFEFVTDPRLDAWLQQHSQKMLSQLSSQSTQEKIRREHFGSQRLCDWTERDVSRRSRTVVFGSAERACTAWLFAGTD